MPDDEAAIIHEDYVEFYGERYPIANRKSPKAYLMFESSNGVKFYEDLPRKGELQGYEYAVLPKGKR